MSEFYAVKKGDTLGDIARRYNVDVDELASANHIKNKNVISVGQQLTIPKKTTNANDNADGWAKVLFRFVDALDQPIWGLKVKLSGDGKDVCTATDSEGLTSLFFHNAPNKPISVHVEKHAAFGGGEKKIASYTPMAGKQTVKVKSGKHVKKTDLRTHAGPVANPPHAIPDQPRGTELETRDQSGNPVNCVVGCECPNSDSLLLGPNNVYRNWVKLAAQRAGVIPQAVAALMNAEAAKSRDGKWLENSECPKSSATGMTQILDGTWVDMALEEGSYLNAKAKSMGWLSRDEQGHIQFKKDDDTYLQADRREVSQNKKGKKNGKHRISHHPLKSLKSKLNGLITGRRNADDDNLQALLDLRYEPEFAIMTAMDYANDNLKALSNQGYAIDGLNDVEKARIMYLCHHLGSGDAVRFIQNEISDDRANALLGPQVSEEKANFYYERNGQSWANAHRAWLQWFIDSHIVPSVFACTGEFKENLKLKERRATLLDITNNIKV